ncbi:MAG: hypothetical protein KIS66_03955 [Fimbriimonadaceae bacterium]|nr:hypothetical protein [Fimbriimonadaceae bacterium]
MHRSASSLLAAACALVLPALGLGQKSTAPRFRMVVSEGARADAEALTPEVRSGVARVERFFGKPFPRSFVVEVFASRAEFDAFVKRRGWMERTERWMVASGVADRMVILAPSVWRAEADEHNPDDREHVRDLVAHELVHVYHGQHNSKPDFDGMDDMGWLTEGLAVLVSGQLDREHRGRALEAIKAGTAPARLADAWSGRYRYAVSGSLVAYVDSRYGRDALRRLLRATTTGDAMRMLKTTETRLLDDWVQSVRGSSGSVGE